LYSAQIQAKLESVIFQTLCIVSLDPLGIPLPDPHHIHQQFSSLLQDPEQCTSASEYLCSLLQLYHIRACSSAAQCFVVQPTMTKIKKRASILNALPSAKWLSDSVAAVKVEHI